MIQAEATPTETGATEYVRILELCSVYQINNASDLLIFTVNPLSDQKQKCE